jgi:hypothetical protein
MLPSAESFSMKPSYFDALALDTMIEVPMFNGQFAPHVDQTIDSTPTLEVTV